MSKQNASTEKTATKQQTKPQPTADPLAEMAEFSNALQTSVIVLNPQGLAGRLGDPRFSATQRQVWTNIIGEVWGNRYTQHVAINAKQNSQSSHSGQLKAIVQRARTAQDIKTNVLDLTGGGKDERSIRRIQQRLIDIGLLTDKKEPDGQLDKSTEEAIKKFQIKQQANKESQTDIQYSDTIKTIASDMKAVENLSKPYVPNMKDDKKKLASNALKSAEEAMKIRPSEVRPNDVTNQALANAWPRRFFGVLLADEQAGFIYIAKQIKARGLPFDENLVNIVGIRGFQGGEVHDNLRMYHRDNRYDDTFFIMALDQNGKPMMREFRGTTDPGATKDKDTKDKNGKVIKGKERPEKSLALGKDQQFLYEYRFSPSEKFGRPMLELRTGEGDKDGLVFDPNRTKLPEANDKRQRQSDHGIGIEPKAKREERADLEKKWLPEEALKDPSKFQRYDRIRVEPYNPSKDKETDNSAIDGPTSEMAKTPKNMFRSRYIAIHSGGGWDTEQVGGDSVGCQVIHGDWFGSFIMTLDRALNWKRVRDKVNVPKEPKEMRKYDKKYVTYTLLDGHDLTPPLSQPEQTSSNARAVYRKSLDSSDFTMKMLTPNKLQDAVEGRQNVHNTTQQILARRSPNTTDTDSVYRPLIDLHSFVGNSFSDSVQRERREHAPFNEVDDLAGEIAVTYTEGELTRKAEGPKLNTLTIHRPHTGNSGVTLGYGYDMGSRSRSAIIHNLTNAGVTAVNAAHLAGAALLKGDAAQQFVNNHATESWATITEDQRTALFKQIYPSYQARARSLATETKPKRSKKGGVNAVARGKQYVVPTEIYDNLHPVIKEILTDLTYPGQYSYGRHEKINLILNDYRLSTLEKLRAIRIYLNAPTTSGIGRAERIKFRTELIDKAIIEMEKKMMTMINERREQLTLFPPMVAQQKERIQSELESLERAYGNTRPSVAGLEETYEEDLTALREQWIAERWMTITEGDHEKRARLEERIRVLEKLYGATIQRRIDTCEQNHYADSRVTSDYQNTNRIIPHDSYQIQRDRSRLTPKEYEGLRTLAKNDKKKKKEAIRQLQSPQNSQSGRGGWLEQNDKNLEEFNKFFSSLLSPLGLKTDDLLILSSDVSRHNPTYRELPPKDLWNNMKNTLEFVTHMSNSTGVTFEIWSAYRSDVVNALSEGAYDSKHMDFAGLDLKPSDPIRFEAFIKYYWYERGNAHKLGLGYYARNRIHIDVNVRDQRSRWKWTDSKDTSRRRYKEIFGNAALPN